MSYDGTEQLIRNASFIGRVAACANEQANLTYKGDAGPANSALAYDVMRGGTSLTAFNRFVAGASGLSDKAMASGTLDQTQISDGDILAAIQANWATIASLYFNPQGVRIA